MISKLQKSGTEQMNFEVGIYRVREELKWRNSWEPKLPSQIKTWAVF
jgi:hypothetical protein